jgi:hypothetical protein
MLLGSASPWIAADCHSQDPITLMGGGCRDDNLRNEGIVLDVLGGVFFVTGIIMTPIGWGQFSRYLQWKKTHRGVSFTPVLHANTNGGMAGIKITF